MGKQYMIRKISEMLERSDICTVESVYRVVSQITVRTNGHMTSPLKILLEGIEQMFYHGPTRNFGK